MYSAKSRSCFDLRQNSTISRSNTNNSPSHQELALGTFDGFSGLFTQPIKGGLEEGGLGVAKGLGKGVMGAVLKPFAGISLFLTLFYNPPQVSMREENPNFDSPYQPPAVSSATPSRALTWKSPRVPPGRSSTPL